MSHSHNPVSDQKEGTSQPFEKPAASHSEIEQPVRQKRVFEQQPIDQQVENSKESDAEPLRQKQEFSTSEPFTESSAVHPVSAIENSAARSSEAERSEKVSIDWLDDTTPKARSPWLLWLLIAFVSISVIQFGVWLWDAYQTSPFLAGAWSLVIAGIVLAGGRVLMGEWRSLRALKQQSQYQRDAERLFNSVQQGEGQRFCTELAANLPDQARIKESLVQWQQAVQPHHQDKEIVALFEQTVIAQCDKYAEQVIKEHATQTALLVALSPLALLDIFIVMIRSVRLIQQVSRCYGVKHGYWSRIRLVKQTVRHMLYVATSELLIDVAGSVIGFELLGKISSRAVQGVGAGLMAGRLGYNAQQLVRPIPKPKLVENGTRKLGKQLVESVLQQVKS